ncbi:ImuA family protein [Roseobacter sinensis]|uniref:Protein ImuA n=1 Tax=Roseobacter sinensis TaxID=2931391 RepID=A0ABT3BGX3_9RHOB|nr:hypothetical protein [Roseobacter sp. WL0113]MCV3272827.1 hypothetical protein [Roseobacter sp. WL0113]
MKRQAEIQQVALSEVFSQTVTDAGAIGFVLSRLPKTSAPILWVQDRLSCKEAGQPYLPGLGVHPPVIWVNVGRPADVLWSMEEGLRCTALSAVIGEVWGAPPALDFTATKRLALRAEAAGVACWLIRRAAAPGLSAARERWRVASLPSAAHPHDPQAPGAPCWQAELFKSRSRKPGSWAVTHDRASDRIDILPPVRDGALAEGNGAHRQRAQR